MRILDLFAGLGGERRRGFIEARGHEYVTLDIIPEFNCTITEDIFKVKADELGKFDFIWASPPCEAFSVASIGHHWFGNNDHHSPKTEEARIAMELVIRTISLIKDISPFAFLIENPRGMLRKMPFMQEFHRFTVCYCRYGESRMKPTDLWGVVPGWSPRPTCWNGNPDHERAPRGARTGTQGIDGAAERAVVPIQLWEEILNALETPVIHQEYYQLSYISA